MRFRRLEAAQEGTKGEKKQVAKQAAEGVGDDISDVGTARPVQEGLEQLNGEAEREREQKTAQNAAFFPGAAAAEGEQKAEGNGHDDVQDQLPRGVAVAAQNVVERNEVHRDIGMVPTEGQRGENRHQRDIENADQIEIHHAVDGQTRPAAAAPARQQPDAVDQCEHEQVEPVFQRLRDGVQLLF